MRERLSELFIAGLSTRAHNMTTLVTSSESSLVVGDGGESVSAALEGLEGLDVSDGSGGVTADRSSGNTTAKTGAETAAETTVGSTETDVSDKKKEEAEEEEEEKPKAEEEEVTKQQEIFFTRNDVADHFDFGDCYVIIGDFVYDVTSFLEQHPGGMSVIVEFAGGDATTAFEDMGHSDEARALLDGLKVGKLA